MLVFAGDVGLLYLSLFLTVFFGFLGEFNQELFFEHLFPFSILYLFWLIVFYIFGLYDLNLIKSKLLFYPRLLGAISINIVVGMIFFYLIPWFGITPKTNLILNIVIFTALIFTWRKLFYSLFSSYLLTRVAIIGNNSSAQKLAEEIVIRPYLGYKLAGVWRIEDNFLSKIEKEKIETLIVAENLASNPELLSNLYQCLPFQINFVNSAQAYETITHKVPLSLINQTWFLENLREGEKIFYDKIKKGMDIVFALFLLILSAPLWFFIALLIKLEDRGPVFYIHERVGKNGNSFLLFKFRSMKKNAEKNGAVWAKRQDPRITRVGKFLRRIHLDELPQMLNVLKGNISLIGPRPERPEFVKKLEEEIPYYHVRHLIKPGFTGWAQIKFRYGRSIMDSQEKFQYDLYYLKNRSLFLDMGILLKTFQLFFKKE
jgi:exopolysaccharide biosynthesis polyprenyl glycosylphosphotransferase